MYVCQYCHSNHCVSLYVCVCQYCHLWCNHNNNLKKKKKKKQSRSMYLRSLYLALVFSIGLLDGASSSAVVVLTVKYIYIIIYIYIIYFFFLRIKQFQKVAVVFLPPCSILMKLESLKNALAIIKK